MRKLAWIAAALSVFVLLAGPAAAAGISARFSFGAGIIRTGDLRDGILGYNDFSSILYGSELRGKFAAPGAGMDPSAEIVFHAGPRWGIGLGFGYASFSKSSEMSYAVADTGVTENLTAGIAAVPLQLNLHFFIPLSERLTIDAWAGPGVALSRLKWEYRMAVDLAGLKSEDRFEFHADRPVFGGQAGIGIFFKLSGAVDLNAEVCGRIASAGGFKGSWTETGSGDFWAISDAGEATVWVFDWLYGAKPYRQLSFQGSKPAGANVVGAEEARIGLTGVSLKIGLRIRLPFSGRAARS
jgi:hypothetical protein